MKRIQLIIDDGVAALTLHCPERLNALDAAMLRDLAAATREIDAAKTVRLLVLRGSGRAFCAGGDIRMLSSDAGDAHDTLLAIGPDIQHIVHWMRHTPMIVVAVVQGAVAGGGLGLMLAADVTICAEDATLTLAYAALGTSPDAGASYFLARALGYRKALELYLMCGQLSGLQAHALGLVNFTVPTDALDAEARTLVARLVAGPLLAHASAKRLFREAADTALHEHLENEIRLFADNARHPDFQEGVRAFLERRRPQFGAQARFRTF